MKQEIRERIEKIRKGEVPEGYRKTKVGIIPVEWSVEKIGALTSSASGTTPSREKQNIYYADGAYLWVKTTDLNNNFINNTSEKITQRALDETSCKLLPKNTILVAMYGGFNQIGRTGLLTKEAACNQALTGLYPNDNFDSKYLQEVLNLRIFYWKKFAASSRKDPNITRNDVMQFPLPHSNKTEEKKIMEILSIWDKAIELKEKLIEEKKELKKGAEKLLITGDVRFFSFNNEWSEMRIKDFTIQKPSMRLAGDLNETGLYPVYGASGIAGYDDIFDNDDEYVAIIKDGSGVGRVFLCEKKTSAIGTLTTIKSNSKSDIGFVYLLMKNINYKKYITGNAIPHIYYKEYSKEHVKMPSLEEQRKIAHFSKILNQYIQNLENELNQLKEQKKGLMQLLLTGIVRVGID
ncbi:hypothetical protein METP3_02402 [Methanosarcinales archaeon]|nr:hypothetical protein METP3_02402 [Methanosarcinales archaeon]